MDLCWRHQQEPCGGAARGGHRLPTEHYCLEGLQGLSSDVWELWGEPGALPLWGGPKSEGSKYTLSRGGLSLWEGPVPLGGAQESYCTLREGALSLSGAGLMILSGVGLITLGGGDGANGCVQDVEDRSRAVVKVCFQVGQLCCQQQRCQDPVCLRPHRGSRL